MKVKMKFGFVNSSKTGVVRIKRGEVGEIMGEHGEGRRRILLVKFPNQLKLVSVHYSYV